MNTPTMTKRARRTAAAVFTCAALAVGSVGIAGFVDAQEQAPIAALNTLSEAFSTIPEKASPAVVFIEVEKNITAEDNPFGRGGRGRGLPPGFEDFFGPGFPMPEQRPGQGPGQGQPMPELPEGPVPFGQGSGFIISPDGYILTNHHVVGEADVVNVQLSDGRDMKAEIVGTDPETEVALLKIDAENLPTIPLADSDKLRTGEWVLAIGSPFGLTHTVTAGIVSASGRGTIGMVGRGDFIQTDAAINPGNSGGPLLNLQGEAVGMNTAILSRSGGYMGVGFAIPINMVKYISEQLRTTGKVARGYLGVSIKNLSSEEAEWFGVQRGQGILVNEVQPDSPAQSAGLERGDVITTFQGQPVSEASSFSGRVSVTAPGTSVSLGLLRNGEKVEKTVELGTFEADETTQARAGGQPQGGVLGIRVQNLSDDLAQRFGLEGQQGVLITEVQQGSPAARAGLQRGMLIQEVNQEKVSNADQFQQVIEAREKGKSVLFYVRDDQGRSLYIAVDAD